MVMLVGESVQSQIVVSAASPINLISNVLQGAGTEVSNITFQGNTTNQLGAFSDPAELTGMSYGMVMSTGNINCVTGANLSDSITESGTNGLGDIFDPDIDMLCNGASNEDQIVLEFDVKVSGDELMLEFVFASDEYPEMVCSSLADVMGITISGPGFAGPFDGGAELMSVTPNGNLPFGINSVNGGSAGSLGDGSCTANSFLNTGIFNTNAGLDMEMDGYSNLVTISSAVECDSIYHIKLMLSDVGGFSSESAIFFKAGGLYSSGIHPRVEPIYNDSSIVEGCKPFFIEFQRPSGGMASNITFNLGGTAINGTDYTGISSPIVFAAGDSIVFLVIEPIDDGILEGPENIVLSYEYLNPCGDTVQFEETFWILDPPDPKLAATFQTNYTYCEGDNITLSADVTGGLPPYNISWGDMPGNNIVYDPGMDVSFVLEIFDEAACAIYADITIDYVPNPVISAGPDVSICKNESHVIQSWSNIPNGSVEWTPSIFLNNDGLIQPTIVDPTLNQTYTMTVTTPEGCSSSDQMDITTLVVPFVDANGGGTILYQQETVEVFGSGSSSNLVWIPEDAVDCSNCLNAEAGPDNSTWIYFIALGANGCRNADSVYVEVIVPKDVFVPSSFSPNGDGNNDVLFARGYTIETMAFKIFDKWGTEVFSTDDRFYGWDGTIAGGNAMPGLYTYTLQVNFVNNEGSANYAGEINLIR
jgi:gliding motility-associated-like protein